MSNSNHLDSQKKTNNGYTADAFRKTEALSLSQRMANNLDSLSPGRRRLKPNSLAIQRLKISPALKVSHPNEPLEIEADRMADTVMSMENSAPEASRININSEKITTRLMRQEDEEQGAEKETSESDVEKQEEVSAKRDNNLQNEQSSNLEKSIDHLGGGTPLSSSERQFFEPRFGVNFSNVRIHNDSHANTAAQSINSKAFTKGNDVVFAKGEYNPESSSGQKLMAHELSHVVQQNSNFYQKAVMREPKENDYAEIGIWVNCYLRNSPDGHRMEGNLLKTGEEVKLIERIGNWLNVKSNTGTQGWIMIDWTSLKPDKDTRDDNSRCQQDIDNFLHKYVFPAFNVWENSLRIQGEAYSDAYKAFQKALDDATKEAKFRADVFAAVLSAVSVGSLGFIGELSLKGLGLTSILNSSAFRGVLEDAIQTGLGEAIDIAQGSWYSKHVNRETDPLSYLNGILGKLALVRSDLTRNLANIQIKIGNSLNRVDRISVLLNIFQWWNGAKLKYTPNISESEKSAFSQEIERGFWQQYILHNLTESVYYLFWGPGYDYKNAESAVKNRMDVLGISKMAGIEEWEAWYERIYDSGREENGRKYYGPDDTQKLAVWARNFQLRQFD